MEVFNIKCKIKHQISTKIICGSYMLEISVIEDMKKKQKNNNDKRKIPPY